MDPGVPQFGGGETGTVLHPIVLVAMLIAILLIFLLPRKYVVVPFLLSAFLIPLGQEVYFGGNHWFVYRIVIVVGLLRLLLGALGSEESTVAGGFNSIDGAFLGCVLVQASCVVIRFKGVAVVNQIAFLLDFLGAYFLLRWLIRDSEDIHRVIKCFAFLAAVLGLAMLWEHFTLRNAFGFLGGVAAVPEVRDGQVRSQGAFQHSLTAGAVGASLVPLFLILWKKGKSQLMAAAGLVGCTLMTLTSNSSTPPLAYAGGLFAVCLWPIRKNMRALRWAIVLGLLALSVVMKAPVWFIIAHIDLTGSSGGYHRAELIDQFIRHFSDWWLVGANDMWNWGFDMGDVQNQFVLVGETGGLIAFLLFLAVVSRCFRRVGYSRKFAESRAEEWGLWFFGAALFANCVGFFGVNYFDQSKVSWFALLAMISAVTAPFLKAHPLKQNAETELSGPHFAYPSPSPSTVATKNMSYQRSRDLKCRMP